MDWETCCWIPTPIQDGWCSITSQPFFLCLLSEIDLDVCSTRYSGIQPNHLRYAPPLSEIRKTVHLLGIFAVGVG